MTLRTLFRQWIKIQRLYILKRPYLYNYINKEICTSQRHQGHTYITVNMAIHTYAPHRYIKCINATSKYTNAQTHKTEEFISWLNRNNPTESHCNLKSASNRFPRNTSSCIRVKNNFFLSRSYETAIKPLKRGILEECLIAWQATV